MNAHPGTTTRLLTLPLAASAAADRVLRDPASVGAALVAGGAAHPMAGAVMPLLRLASHAGDRGARLLLAHRTGDEAAVASAVASAAQAGPAARRGIARALLAAGRHPGAGDLVAADTSPAGRSLHARALWAGGLWEEAIASTPSQGQAKRWREEVDVLSRRPPAAPALPAPRGAAPDGRALRVLHLVTNSLPHTRSGYTGRTHEVLLAQRAAGTVVRAVTPLAYPASLLRLPTGVVEQVDGIEYERLLPRRWSRSPARRHRQEQQMLDDVVARFRPDVLHAHSHFVNAFAALDVGRRHGIPVVYEVRGLLEETWVQRSGPGARATDRYRIFRAQEAAAVGAVDAALTLGKTMRDALTTRARPRREISLVPNAVSAASLSTRGDREATRARLGVPPDGFVVGSVSSLVDYEGFDLLVEAVARLGGSGTAVTLLLVGDGDAAPLLRSLGRAVPDPARVVMPGRVPRAQVADHLAALDVFVVPRRDLEVCRMVTPLKPAEAMAAGLPLVVSDLPALREFVDDGVEGLVVPPEDAGALAEALARLTDPGLRAALGAQGRRRVTETRTWEANVRTYERVYQEVSSP